MISTTLESYLSQHNIHFDVISHRHTYSSMDISSTAHVPAAEIAKSVILEDDQGYVMAVIPSHQHVKINKINELLGRKMGLATEKELSDLFPDCELGAIPPVGQAYGMKTIVDDCLGDCPDIYLEAGNHEELVHISGELYRSMMANELHSKIS